MKRSSTLLFVCMAAIVCVQLVYYGFHLYARSVDDSPKAQLGVLDLTGWDADAGKAVALDGQWAFDWNELLAPGDRRPPAGFYRVPSHWRGQVGGRTLASKGVATYRLTVKLQPSERIYALRLSYIHMSSAVYVDGVPVGGSGRPAADRNRYVPENKPYNVYFHVAGETAEIVVQVANYDHAFGGISNSIQFGTAHTIDTITNRANGMELMMIVALLMLGIYHIGAFVGRRRERGLLYFGAYCLVAALAFACYGGKLFMQVLPGVPFEIDYKLQAATVHTSLILLILFLREMCAGLIPGWLTRALLVTFGSFTICIVLLPFRFYIGFNYFFQPLEIVSYATMIGVLAFAYRQGRYGSFNRRGLFMLIMALCCLLVSLMDSGMFLINWIARIDMTIWSTIAYSVLISLLLAFRFSEAFATIENMSQRLLDMDKLKDEFLANTSHEFQTPLNGIINMSQYMMEGGTGHVTEQQKHHLTIVLSTARKLSSLVRDILDMEKIKRNEIELRLADVDAHVTASVVLEVFHFLTSGKKITIVNRIPPLMRRVRADENRLRQIMFNLLGNAVKFTDHGTVTIEAETTDEWVKIVVADTGIGIAPAQHGTIFALYEQERGIARQYGGTGLGLSISRRLAELMGGRLELEWSVPGEGTRMALYLPASEAAWSAPAQQPEPVASLRPAAPADDDDAPAAGRVEGGAAYREAAASAAETFTLLAVDDEPANLHVLTNMFRGEGVRILTATGGRDALKLLHDRQDIDLVLLDVMMPRMSGYDVCRRIRQRYSLFELPVVMLTVRSAPEDVAAGFQAGANDFVVKPFDAREVRARVLTLLQLKASVQQALAAEMAFLQSQIKPHFLYNALNAILSFCLTDGARAAELIAHLSSFLRRSFDFAGTQQFVSLSGELELVRAYAAIEQARFEERLVLEYDIDESLLLASLPPLTIQPLVENAIRHGIMSREEGGVVKLTVKAHGAGIAVEVSDNGVGMSVDKTAALLRETVEESKGRTGIGLANIHRRLHNLYGEGLRIESAEQGGTTVSFRIRRAVQET